MGGQSRTCLHHTHYWGQLSGKSGDYVVKNFDDDPADVWIVDQTLFAATCEGEVRQITHPIGKCIFVFAGGTRHRFADFGVYVSKQEEDAGKQSAIEFSQDERQNAADWETKFRSQKGPDFKSRLAGYLDVLGPNRRPPTAGFPEDVTFPIRQSRQSLMRRLLFPPAPAYLEIA